MSGKPRIVFVDDEPDLLAGLRLSLRKLRREWDMSFVECAVNAWPEAVADADVVVSDLRMPGMNGGEFLERVRERYPSVGRIVLSGQADEDLTLEAATVAHGWMHKPASPALIIETIREILAIRERLAEPRVRAVVFGARGVPTFPRLYREVRTLIEQDTTSMSVIAAAVESDPGMVARVLQLANSALFARATPVENLAGALCVLGLDAFSQIVLTAEVLALLEPAGSTAGVEELTKHARAMVDVMRGLFEDPIESATAATIGALHDAGRVLLAASPLEDASLHQEVAAGLAAAWGLPSDIVNALATHHRLGDAPDDREFAIGLRVAEAIVDGTPLGDVDLFVSASMRDRMAHVVHAEAGGNE